MHSLLGNIRSLVTRVAPGGRTEETVHPLDEPLRLLGLERRALRGDVHVHSGRIVELASVAKPIELVTSDLALYAQWVGSATVAAAHVEMPLPERPWPGRAVETLADLTEAERIDVERARHALLFGDASAVEGYRAVVEKVHAPFRANVFALRSLYVAAGAQVVVTGLPAVLVVDRVTIEELGQLTLVTACRAWINRLEKKPAAAH